MLPIGDGTGLGRGPGQAASAPSSPAVARVVEPAASTDPCLTPSRVDKAILSLTTGSGGARGQAAPVLSSPRRAPGGVLGQVAQPSLTPRLPVDLGDSVGVAA